MAYFDTESTTQEVVASLGRVKGRLWERHGYRRIYVDVELTCEGANTSMDRCIGNGRFYLNLVSETWMLTGRTVDREIVAYLNGLTGINFLTQVTKPKQTQEPRTPEPEQFEPPEPTVKTPQRHMSNDELRLFSDATLISLIQNSERDYDDDNLWALRISRIAGLSFDVITALIEADKDWYENRNIVRQENFPAGFQERLIRRGKQNNRIARCFASDAGESSADTLRFLALNSTSKTVLKEVSENTNTPMDALLHLRKKMMVPALLTHRDTTNELLAELASDHEYALLILTKCSHLEGGVVDILKASEDAEIRKLLISRHAYLFTATEMLDYTSSLTVEALKAWSQTVSDDIVMTLLQDARPTVVRNTREELISRGYVEHWTKPTS